MDSPDSLSALHCKGVWTDGITLTDDSAVQTIYVSFI